MVQEEFMLQFCRKHLHRPIFKINLFTQATANLQIVKNKDFATARVSLHLICCSVKRYGVIFNH